MPPAAGLDFAPAADQHRRRAQIGGADRGDDAGGGGAIDDDIGIGPGFPGERGAARMDEGGRLAAGLMAADQAGCTRCARHRRQKRASVHDRPHPGLPLQRLSDLRGRGNSGRTPNGLRGQGGAG